MTFSRQVWSQLKNTSAEQLISALRRDGWKLDSSKGGIRVYRHDDGRRVAIHYHPQKTFGAKLCRRFSKTSAGRRQICVASN